MMNPLPRYKPMVLSKRVLRTNRVNETENQKLREEIERIDCQRVQRSTDLQSDLKGLRKSLSQIQTVRAKMDFGVERRRFLAEKGVTISHRDIDIDDFIAGIDQFVLHDKVDDAKVLKRGVRQNKGRAKSSYGMGNKQFLGNQYLQLTVGIQVDNKGQEESEEEQGEPEKYDRPVSAPTLMAKKPKYIFREIVPPVNGRPVEQVYKQQNEEAKLLLKLKEKELLNIRARNLRRTRTNSTRTRKSSTNEPNANRRLHGEIGGDDDNLFQVQNHMDDLEIQDVEFPELDSTENIAVGITRSRSGTEEKETAANLKSLDVSDDSTDLSQKFLNLTEQNIASHTNPNQINLTSSKEYIESSNFVGKEPRSSIEECADLNVHTAWTDTPFDNAISDNDEIPDELSQSKMDIRENWLELVDKIKKDLEDNNRDSTRSRKARTHKKIKRTISKPAAMSGEVIYDARPDKAVTKGYSLMRVKTGKNVVSIFMPAYKNDTVMAGQIKSRANVKSAIAAQHSRLRREERVTANTDTLNMDKNK